MPTHVLTRLPAQGSAATLTLALAGSLPPPPTHAALPSPPPSAPLRPPDPHNKTERFRRVLQQPADFMTPELCGQLRRCVFVIVRGYLSSLYRACLGAYLDHQAAAAEALGMRVLVGNVCCCSTSARNSAALFAQIGAHTAPGDRVILLAHSHGTLAALDLLCNPAYAAVSERVECFIALNGVFGGTPMADLCTGSGLVSSLLEATWGRLLAVVGGGEAGVLRDMTAAARRAYNAQHGGRIAAVVRRVAVVALASHYRWPRHAAEAAGLAMLPQRMVMDALGWAPNDGCVPLASQLLPGADYVVCEGLHHVHTVDDLGAMDLRALTHALLVLASEARVALVQGSEEGLSLGCVNSYSENAWFTFIAAYAVIARLSPFDAATHTALFLICRRVPYLLLFPVTGLAADRLNRGALLVAVCLLEGAVSFTLPLVQQRQDIWLLYPLVFCQYCAQAFYDPARAAAIPGVVPRPLICVAGTLDTFGFSLMALGGAALAGHVAAVYGTAACFRIEGAAFLLAAVLMLPLATAAHGGSSASRRRRSGAAASEAAAAMAAAAAAAAAPEVEAPPELQPLLHPPPQPALDHGLPRKHRALGRDHAAAQRRNMDVAVQIWIKATGAMVWGAADILNGRFATDRAMQSLGGPDQTLGFILAAVGAGCVAGPLFANSITPGVARCWRVSVASAFGMLAAGYAVMAVAPNIFWVLPATCIRASGSNTLYIHSFAILQHRLHEGIRGRVFAVEFVLFTISEASSSLAAGWALDGLGWSEERLSMAMALLASCFMGLWAAYVWWMWRMEGSSTTASDEPA
ncbi:hypothetical protein HXX76_011237 [Chlamydomonas incerta]|uniref:Uncharacterized protein n=1 Tax=Chlamydomonas incerta TaxID=51695 RepID=A0A835SKY4_CHLIN|nr:hypothetical protein HXX76_011237 [Chlamydomonas incerta]|eukprot:KAG2428993.1 hypothetical protein HXX76_011237 [Chlamydomonas incerta]